MGSLAATPSCSGPWTLGAQTRACDAGEPARA
jgi:hypothetical protein